MNIQSTHSPAINPYFFLRSPGVCPGLPGQQEHLNLHIHIRTCSLQHLPPPPPFFVSLNDIYSKPSYSFKLLSHINRAFFNYTNSTLYSLCDLHDFSASPFESRAQRHYSSHSDSAGTRVHTTPRETYTSLSLVLPLCARTSIITVCTH